MSSTRELVENDVRALRSADLRRVAFAEQVESNSPTLDEPRPLL